MSFAADVKNELARLSYSRPCCRRAEVAGLLRLGASMTLRAGQGLGLTFTTENAAVARKALVLLKELAPVETEITVSRFRRLKKNNSYTVRVVPGPAVEGLFAQLGLTPETMPQAGKGGALLRRSCCRLAYLRGAFQAGGSVNRPEADCHLEIVAASFQPADLLHSLLKRCGFSPGITDRKEEYVVYLKEGDAISDFLSMMEAEAAVEAYEVARNVKEVRNQVNRLVNCETANINKTADAAARQIADIRLLEAKGLLAHLSEPLRETAAARLENPGATLSELAVILGAGRSGVNHRLRKLAQLAHDEGEEH
ncbi:MAG: DNA-binding protein WhiA [Schwartzia sp.]|nr:DNA-binding protein WhiA [Schwartzia sp. (in: firmicutes)]